MLKSAIRIEQSVYRKGRHIVIDSFAEEQSIKVKDWINADGVGSLC
jgi:hypothetical protein